MMLTETLKKQATERRRGWIIKYLYESRPTPLEVSVVQELLDFVNFPLSCRQLIQELDFLRSENLVRVFPLGAEKELGEVEQAKLLQRCTDDEQMRTLSVRIRTAGINLQEGNHKVTGVARIR